MLGNGISSDDIPDLQSRWRRLLRIVASPFVGKRRKHKAVTRKNRQAVDQWCSQMKHADRPARPAKRDIWIG
jgi:hypothetical protein